jgi:hypothetical protein
METLSVGSGEGGGDGDGTGQGTGGDGGGGGLKVMLPSVVGGSVGLFLVCALVYWKRDRCRPLYVHRHAAERDEFCDLDRSVPTLFKYHLRERQEEASPHTYHLHPFIACASFDCSCGA